MIDWPAIQTLLSTATELVRNHAPAGEWASAVPVAVGAIVAGLTLALWGSRLLRTLYVLGFMALGGVIGKEVAIRQQVDVLIGLVVGAGVLAAVGYALYRWWIGVTTALLATVLAVALSAPKLLEARQSFEDNALGMSTQVFQPGAEVSYSGDRVWQYFWEKNRSAVYNTLGPIALSGLMGLIFGLLLPRAATIVGTSLLGVLILFGGLGVLLAQRWPEAWARAQSNGPWSAGVAIAVFILSMMYQATHTGRKVAAPEPAPAPAAQGG